MCVAVFRSGQNGCKDTAAELQLHLAEEFESWVQSRFASSRRRRSRPCHVLFLGPWTGAKSTDDFRRAATETTRHLQARLQHFQSMLQPLVGANKRPVATAVHSHCLNPDADPVSSAQAQCTLYYVWCGAPDAL